MTNGLGGYAMGTVAGMLSRSYHGLLIAAMAPPGAPGLPPAARTLLLAKLDETADYDGRRYLLYTDQRADEPRAADPWITPKGYRHLERFHLEGTTPVWTYALADARMEKRVWMEPGANTTYVQYRLTRASRPLTLHLAALATYRDHHGNVAESGLFPFQVEPVGHGLRLAALDAPPFYLLSQGAQAGANTVAAPSDHPLFFIRRDTAAPPSDHPLSSIRRDTAAPPSDHPLSSIRRDTAAPPSDHPLSSIRCDISASPTWQPGYHLAVEHYRGQKDLESYCHAADGSVTLRAGEVVTIVASAEAAPDLDGAAAYARRQAYEASLMELARPGLRLAAAADGPGWLAVAVGHLALAADQFVVRRDSAGESGPEEGRSIIAGYPWFGDWGRDTMIALPGLTLVTGRPEVARQVLRTFARAVDRGMLPNRFPDAGETPEYNTIDATLWYFEALRAYHAATGDDSLLAELYPVLQEIVAWHRRGTRYRIHMDEADGLLYGGVPEEQLTWMDAKLDDWVVTPRIGKPVEISALWYNGLRSLAGFARRLGHEADAAGYDALADRAQVGFARFWSDELGYCYDVLDGPDGDDPSLRPNQLFAVSLHHSPLSDAQAAAVVDVCARHLLTSHGLRSLAPDHPDYIGHYGGDRHSRDAAYHQGTVWGWLLGPFVSAHYKVHRDRNAVRSFLLPMLQHLHSHGVGSLSEIFDGDPPFTPRACPAQAWSVGEVLRVWTEVEG
ncbi:MAG: amylo-alpha-1,6-glucosidase [Anaerolineae bacterium]